MKKKANYITVLIFAVLAGIIFYLMRDYPSGDISKGFGPSFYPTVLLCVLLVLLLILLIQTLTGKGLENDKADLLPLKQIVKPALILVGMLAYAILMPYLGFIITGILYLFAVMMILKADWKKSIIISVAVTVIIYVAFRYVFKVPLPTGTLLGGLF